MGEKQMTVYCMNLKDNRDSAKRNADVELKFRTCLEESMVAIGWAVPDAANTWEEYINISKPLHYGKGYSAAINNLQRMEKGDLVWVKNPVSKALYLVEITDDAPSVRNDLKELDICGYRKGVFYPVDKAQCGKALTERRLSVRGTLERVHKETRGDVCRETVRLLKKLKKAAKPANSSVNQTP